MLWRNNSLDTIRELIRVTNIIRSSELRNNTLIFNEFRGGKDIWGWNNIRKVISIQVIDNNSINSLECLDGHQWNSNTNIQYTVQKRDRLCLKI